MPAAATICTDLKRVYGVSVTKPELKGIAGV